MATPTDRPCLKSGDQVRLQESFPAQGLHGAVGTVVRITGPVVVVEIADGVRLMCMDYHVEKIPPSVLR